MITNINLKASKTYATFKNAMKAADKMVKHLEIVNNKSSQDADFRFIIGSTEDGRLTPVFIGSDCNAVIFNGFMWCR